MRRGWLAGALLAAPHLAVALAGWLAPYPYAEQHRDLIYAPPTRIHLWDGEGRFRGPFVYGIAADGDGYREDTGRRYRLWLALPGRLFKVESPGAVFLLGTDAVGRDLFSRTLYGGRVSILTGLAATLVALGLGLAAGLAAGWWRKWADPLLMRTGELTLALPRLYLLLAVRAALPLHVSPFTAAALLVAVIGGFGWVRPGRLVRAVTLEARERGYVAAASGFGASWGYLMRRHLVPAALPVLLTQATVLIPQYVLAEVALSFLGLGIGEPLPSWGNMLSQARQYHAVAEHWWLLAPALALMPLLAGHSVAAERWLRAERG